MLEIRNLFLSAALFFAIILSLSCKNNTCKKVCFRDVCVKVKIADTPLERQNGLMLRKYLADNEGLLFIFEQEGIYSFWMKNMRFALDIIWVSNEKKIVDIKTGVLPCGVSCESLIPSDAARYVLEVNSGFTAKHNLKIGEKIKF